MAGAIIRELELPQELQDKVHQDHYRDALVTFPETQKDLRRITPMLQNPVIRNLMFAFSEESRIGQSEEEWKPVENALSLFKDHSLQTIGFIIRKCTQKYCKVGTWQHNIVPSSEFLNTLLHSQQRLKYLELLAYTYSEHSKSIKKLKNLQGLQLVFTNKEDDSVWECRLPETLKFIHLKTPKDGFGIANMKLSMLSSSAGLSCIVLEGLRIERMTDRSDLEFLGLKEIRIIRCEGMDHLFSRFKCPGLRHLSIVYDGSWRDAPVQDCSPVNDFLSRTEAQLHSFFFSLFYQRESPGSLSYKAVQCHSKSLKYIGFESQASCDEPLLSFQNSISDVVEDFPELDILHVPAAWIVEIPKKWQRLRFLLVTSDRDKKALHELSGWNSLNPYGMSSRCEELVDMAAKYFTEQSRLEGVVVRGKGHYEERFRHFGRHRADAYIGLSYDHVTNGLSERPDLKCKICENPSGKSVELLRKWFPYSDAWMPEFYDI